MSDKVITKTTNIGKYDDEQKHHNLPVWREVHGMFSETIEFIYIVNGEVYKTLAEIRKSEIPADLLIFDEHIQDLKIGVYWKFLQNKAIEINNTEYFNFKKCIYLNDICFITIVKDDMSGKFKLFSYITEVETFDSFDDAMEYAENKYNVKRKDFAELEEKHLE